MCVSGSEHHQRDLTAKTQYSGENKQVPFLKKSRGIYCKLNNQLYGSPPYSFHLLRLIKMDHFSEEAKVENRTHEPPYHPKGR